MRIAARLFVLCLLLCGGLGCWSTAASALSESGVTPVEAVGPVGPISLEVPFSESHALTPEQLAVDAASRTKFSGLAGAAAVALAEQDFDVQRPLWTPPGTEEGGKIEGYIGERSALVALPSSSHHVVVSSTVPLESYNGSTLAPVSFALKVTNGVYVPANPLVQVAISSRASGGVSFGSGVSVAPLAAGGEAPVVVGNSLVFHETARDTDYLVEPVPNGAEVSWLLRSQESPESDPLAFSLPAGASLQSSATVPGGVEVVEEGKPVVVVPPAVAQGADGRPIATSYSINGNTLTIHVSLSGSIDFPVKVDPLLIGDYGAANSAHGWTGWEHCGTYGCTNSTGCTQFCYYEYPELIQVGTNPGPGNEAYGEWYIYAPGHASSEGAGITRVDLSNVTHRELNQSAVQGEIFSSNGSEPIYTYDGAVEKDDRPQPLNTDEALTNQPIAFCAQSAKGEDGGKQPLCDEVHDQGQGFYIDDKLGPEPRTVYNYTQLTGATVTYRDEYGPNEISVSGLSEEWLKASTEPSPQIHAHDAGLGIQKFELQIPPGSEPSFFKEEKSCNQPNGFVGCPQTETSEPIKLTGVTTGVWTLGIYAVDAAKNVKQLLPDPKIYVDNTKPVFEPLAGALAQAANKTIGDGNYTLNFTAVDGSAAAPQSGVDTIEVQVDGQHEYTTTNSCGKPKGLPEGCYAWFGSWTMRGGTYGAGTHTITVVAKDWAGNEETSSFKVTVTEANYESVGPGAVNLESGNYQLAATDASIPSGATALSVVRTFNSQSTAQTERGPLGPNWTLSVAGATSQLEWHSLASLKGGSAIALTGTSGGTVTFAQNGGGYTSPAGFQTDTLSKSSSTEYKLSDTAGDYTLFKEEAGTASFVPTQTVQASGAGGLNPIKTVFAKSPSGPMEPKEVIGPEPSPEACKTTLVKGCRALTFVYTTAATEPGENESEWGNYQNHLQEITFTAWEPIKSEMKTTTVAQYAYDKQDRLRSEWDPRITPKPLKTDYGYNSENLVTALTPPGQQTWAVSYGTILSDATAGRAVKVTRGQASTPLWKGAAPANTEVPSIVTPWLGLPEEGTTIGVAVGKWSNEPLVYSYQWEECNSVGQKCQAILGATNQTLSLARNRVGYKVFAVVTATNGGGSATVASVMSEQVKQEGHEHHKNIEFAPEPGSTIEYGIPASGEGAPTPMGSKEVGEWGQSDDPRQATAIFPPDEPQEWPASSYARATLFYLDTEGHTVNTASPSGAISTAEYLPGTNNISRTLSADNRAAALKEGSKSATVAVSLSTQRSYNTLGTEVVQILGPEHPVKLDGGGSVTGRPITTFEYDQGEPGGGAHDLVTTTTQGLQRAAGNVEDKRTIKTSYSGQENLGWKLHAPTSSTTSAGSVSLKSTTTYEPSTGQVEETQTPAAAGKNVYVPATTYASQFGTKGSGAGQLEQPTYDAINTSGDVWVTEYKDNRVSEFSPTGTFIKTIGWGVSNGEAKLEVCTSSCKAGIAGTGKEQLAEPTGIAISGENLYIVDSGNNRIQVISEAGKWEKQWGAAGTEEGHFKIPLAIAITPTGSVWVGDSTNRRMQEFTLTGTFVEAIGFGVSNGETKFQICKSKCQAGIKGTEPGQFASTWGAAIGNGKLYVTDTGNNRVEEFNEKGEIAGGFGSAGTGNGNLESPIGIAISPTTGDVDVTDTGDNRVEEFTPAGSYITQFGAAGTGNGQLEFPEGDAVNAAGDIYVVDDLNHRVEKWAPTIGNEGAHTTQTIYYAAGTARNTECSNHPEWAGLPCQAGPIAQPETGLPNLPVTTHTYNMWQEPLTTTDTVGTTKRTTTISYDAAGRPEAATITANADTALPPVTNKYNERTGALEEQSTTTEKHTETLTLAENTLGQMTSYTDADGNTSTYEYEKEKDDRLIKISDGKGTQAFGYNTTTGLLSSLEDSAAGTFTVGRDLEGNITSETYPNGMAATDTLNAIGERTGLEYTKGKDIIYGDTVIPSVHGQWLSQTSSLSSENYVYTEPGWLAEVQETPTGKGCTNRLYAFDEDGNRTSQTTREPGSEGKCATEGGTAQNWSYDTADQLDETGVTYDPFGNTTTLPAGDAGGNTLISTFYVNNMLATLEQGEQKIAYELDPSGRTLETISTGSLKSTMISHYASPAGSPAWSATGSSWTRYIGGIGGGLDAIQTTASTTLQVANLHGDIIGAVPDTNEAEPKLANASETTEYGVPRTSKPEPYSWLGADERRTELPTGIIAMGARAYIPELGRFEQTDPQSGASINAYAYTSDDPINEADPGGEHGGTITYDEEAIAEGEGEDLPGGGGIGPGAIMPPPVNMQIEEEGNAQSASSAASEYPAVIGFWGQALAGGDTPVAVAAAPCAHGDNPHSGSCGARLPGHQLCSNPLLQGCRVTNRFPSGVQKGRLEVLNHKVGPVIGCVVGGLVGGEFAADTSVGLATEVGYTGGCFVGGTIVIIVEDIF